MNRFVFLGLILLQLVFVSCSELKENEIIFDDDLGRKVKISKVNTVISLAPSITEYSALICPHKLSGRTQNCDYPAWVKNKPLINNYPELDIEEIIRLKPDLILSQKGITSQSQIELINRFKIPIYIFDNNSIKDVISSCKIIGDLTGCQTRGVEVRDSLRDLFRTLKSEIKTVDKKGLAIVSKNPIYLYGSNTILDEILDLYQIDNLAGSLQSSFPEVDEEFIIRQNPEILISSSKLDWELFFKEHQLLQSINAYRKGALYNINGDYISRQGPRVFGAIEQLNKLLK